LGKLDLRASQVVELRFFGDLTDDEVAKTLNISSATVRRDWDFAHSWLLRPDKVTAGFRNLPG
jgi:DNA-binding transcriptional regulator LsrR (DeoR family)